MISVLHRLENSATCPIMRACLGYTNGQQVGNKCNPMTLDIGILKIETYAWIANSQQVIR